MIDSSIKFDSRKKLKKVATVQRSHKYHRSNFTKEVSFNNSPEASQTELPITSRQIAQKRTLTVSTSRRQSRD